MATSLVESWRNRSSSTWRVRCISVRARKTRKFTLSRCTRKPVEISQMRTKRIFRILTSSTSWTYSTSSPLSTTSPSSHSLASQHWFEKTSVLETSASRMVSTWMTSSSMSLLHSCDPTTSSSTSSMRWSSYSSLLTYVEAVASNVPSWFIAKHAMLFSCAWTLTLDFYSIRSPECAAEDEAVEEEDCAAPPFATVVLFSSTNY